MRRAYRVIWLMALLAVTHLSHAQTQNLEPVSLQLKWTHLFQFAGFYVAKEKGYYRDAGFDVQIRQKGPGINVVDEVLGGRATYGVSDSALILERMRGRNVVALKALFQHSPLILISRKDAGIDSLDAVRGRRVMIAPESSQNVSIMAMLKSHGMSLDDLKVVPMSFNLEDLIDKKVDAFTAYLTDQPFTLQERGIAYSVLNPADYGFDFYGDILFTSEHERSHHPQRLKRFVDASMKGWRYAFDHIDETIEILKAGYVPESVSRTKLRAEAEALRRISGIDEGRFGQLEREKIGAIANTFAVMGHGVGSSSRLDSLVHDVDAFNLTAAERAFVEAHPLIRVSSERDWPPYDYLSDGLPEGYSIDYMKLLAKKIGVELEFVTDSWTNLQEKLKTKQIDAVHLMSKTPEREAYALYSDLYVTSSRVIVTQRSETGIHSMDDLENRRVAVVEGWAISRDMEKRYPQMEPVKKESAEALLDAVAFGEADAAVMDYAVANHLIQHKMLGNLKIAARVTPDENEKLYIGVRNDWPLLQQIFDKALRHVSSDERLALNTKWLAANDPRQKSSRIYFTAAEQIYLQSKQRLSACVDPNWMPLEKIEEGKYIGMGSEYLKLFEERLNIPIDVLPTKTWAESVRNAKSRQCDMYVFSMDTPERRTYMNITTPLIAPPLVLATRMDAWFYTDLHDLGDEKIGIVDGYALADIIREKYPNIHFVYVASIDEGLQMVADGALFGFLDAFPVLGYMVQQHYLGDLKIAGRFEDTWDLGVALRNDAPELYTIFQKIVDSLSDDEHRKIENQWVAVTYEKGFDYTLMWQLALLFAAIMTVMLYRNRQLLRHKRELDEKNRELEDKKAQMDFIAYHDALTMLPNRTSFQEKLSHAIGLAKRNKTRVAVLFVDLDRFKIVNDTLGHDVGDEMLKEIAGRLQTTLRETDTLSRIGGDEFTVLIESLHHANDAAFVAEKILEAVKKPIKTGRYELGTTASVGIALYPEDGDAVSTLIKNADSAMYLAKSVGKDSYRFYTKKLSDDVHRRMHIEHELRIAMEKSELSIVYQPQYDLARRRVVAAEALLRWKHSSEGEIAPAEFIPIAEDSGMILQIGEWVFEMACREFMRWKALGFSIDAVAVNVSSVQFNQENIVERFKSITKRVGIDPQSVEIEITERYIMEHTQHNQTILEELRNIGFRISIDDFGTGYSSMSYLKTLPLDTIKIDKSFIDDIPHDKNDVAISKAILAVAKSLDYTVVAEGIEYSEQERFLLEHGCDIGQGYLFSRPLSADDFLVFMQERGSSE